MKKYLNNLPKELKHLIHLCRDIASQQHVRAYLVGGFVRGLLLGAENLDLDIVVEGDAIKFAAEFARGLNGKLIRHHRFGTATVKLKPQLKVDFATARKEAYPAPAQLPEVSRGSLKDDLFRRDFTINCLAISISRDDFGSLIDFFGGKTDLERKKIRVLHGLSFQDDPTRVLRAIRFEQRYQFRIEPFTLRKLKEAVKSGMLDKTGPHRLRDELILILKERKPLQGLKRLEGLAGLSFISPGLKLPVQARKLSRAVEKEIAWFKDNFPRRRPLDSWLIYFLALLDPLSLSAAGRVCAKFAFRRGEEKRILCYKKIKGKFISDLKKYRAKPAKIFALLEPLSYEVILAAKARYRDPAAREAITDFFRAYNGMRVAIGGEDLCRLGVKPGPVYQRLFARVLRAKLNGRVRTKAGEVALIKKLCNSSAFRSTLSLRGATATKQSRRLRGRRTKQS